MPSILDLFEPLKLCGSRVTAWAVVVAAGAVGDMGGSGAFGPEDLCREAGIGIHTARKALRYGAAIGLWTVRPGGRAGQGDRTWIVLSRDARALLAGGAEPDRRETEPARTGTEDAPGDGDAPDWIMDAPHPADVGPVVVGKGSPGDRDPSACSSGDPSCLRQSGSFSVSVPMEGGQGETIAPRARDGSGSAEGPVPRRGPDRSPKADDAPPAKAADVDPVVEGEIQAVAVAVAEDAAAALAEWKRIRPEQTQALGLGRARPAPAKEWAEAIRRVAVVDGPDAAIAWARLGLGARWDGKKTAAPGWGPYLAIDPQRYLVRATFRRSMRAGWGIPIGLRGRVFDALTPAYADRRRLDVEAERRRLDVEAEGALKRIAAETEICLARAEAEAEADRCRKAEAAEAAEERRRKAEAEAVSTLPALRIALAEAEAQAGTSALQAFRARMLADRIGRLEKIGRAA